MAYVYGKRGVVCFPAFDVALQVGWQGVVGVPEKVEAAGDACNGWVKGAMLVGPATVELDGNLNGGKEQQQRAGKHVEVTVARGAHPWCILDLLVVVCPGGACEAQLPYLGLAKERGHTRY